MNLREVINENAVAVNVKAQNKAVSYTHLTLPTTERV